MECPAEHRESPWCLYQRCDVLNDINILQSQLKLMLFIINAKSNNFLHVWLTTNEFLETTCFPSIRELKESIGCIYDRLINTDDM